ncbi:hypothetical protein [Escherichia sp. 93.0743]|nr:hypothetical protein [Escherichia sp. 93.0743]MBB2346562.1 hypothetical protein [Escherichia sp. 93.0743]
MALANLTFAIFRQPSGDSGQGYPNPFFSQPSLEFGGAGSCAMQLQ